MNTSTSSTDVLVIGGGQAGLATGYWLKKRDIDFQIIDGSARVGDSWRNRYDSLVLFTPRAFSALPGLPVPGDPEGYPTKDEIADYLETYALTHHLPVTLGTCATQLTQVDDDGFIASTSTGSRISTRTVIVASGGFQKPVIPRGALGFSSSVLQISASGYRNPSQVAGGKVLVCGDGATGRQIAAELSRTHTVLLSTGRPRRVAPERLLGKSVFWWAAKLGLLRASRHSRIGKGMMRSDSFPGKHLRLGALRKLGITPVGRFLEAEGTTASFSDGLSAQVDAVIWSTGYREDDSWVDIPEAKDSNGVLLQERGRTPVSGLYTKAGTGSGIGGPHYCLAWAPTPNNWSDVWNSVNQTTLGVHFARERERGESRFTSRWLVDRCDSHSPAQLEVFRPLRQDEQPGGQASSRRYRNHSLRHCGRLPVHDVLYLLRLAGSASHERVCQVRTPPHRHEAYRCWGGPKTAFAVWTTAVGPIAWDVVKRRLEQTLDKARPQ